MSFPVPTHQATTLWQRKLVGITSLLLGSFFEYENVLVLGMSSGNLRVLKDDKVVYRLSLLNQQDIELLETKGGAVQSITLHNITNIRGNELVAGNLLLFFC